MPTGWKEFFENDEVKNEIKTISKWLEQTEKRTIFPALSDVWKALVWTSAKDCRVVILGQDPYHTLMGCEEGVTDTIPACGIAFMVKSGHQINPSLQNIFKELKSCGFNVNSKKGDLTRWCRSGILLLNTALTVAEGQPESHLGKWKNFTNMLLDYIGKKSLGLLWGKPSIAFKDKFKSTVCTTHPSPLAAYKSTATVGSFIGSLCFNKVNEELRKLDMEEVDWNLSE
jgi:uracil-DNA glycosylase